MIQEYQESSDSIQQITHQVHASMQTSDDLDMARRRAIWEVITPIALMLAGVAGVIASPAGLGAMLCVMALTFVGSATVSRLVWPW